MAVVVCGDGIPSRPMVSPRLTASRGAARPAKASIAPKPNTGLAGIGRRSPERSGGGSIELLGGDDFVEALHEKSQGFRREATDLLAEPLCGQRSDLADLDPGLLREPGLIGEFERQWEAGFLRSGGEGHDDNSA